MAEIFLEMGAGIGRIIIDGKHVASVCSVEDGLRTVFVLNKQGCVDARSFQDLSVMIQQSGLPKFTCGALPENVARCAVINGLIESQGGI